MKSTETSAVRLEAEIENLGAGEIGARRSELINILRTNRDTFVLAAAIRALASSPKVSLRVLRDATTFVKEPLALADLLELFGERRDARAAPLLRRFAAHGPQGLVRGAALDSLGLLGRPGELSFLKRLERSERSRYARASLLRAMHRLGNETSFAKLLTMLKSRDYRLRCRVANLLADVKDPTDRSRAIHALKSALKKEKTIAARSSITGALKEI